MSDQTKLAVPEHQTYYVNGHYFESCNCLGVCPCLLLDPPTEGYCEAFPSWQIEQGRLGDTVLDGLNVAIWLRTPGALTEGNWRIAMYIDERATPEQHKAIEELWGGKHGGYLEVIASLVSDVLGVRSAKIDWKEDDNGHRVMTVEGVGGVDIQAIEGMEGQDVVLSGMPLAVAPPFAVTVARSNSWTFNDHGLKSSWSRTSGLSSPFSYFA
jgi:hypothetical protein